VSSASHTTVNRLPVINTNGLGTAFTVGDLGTAFQIAGGPGQDTIPATGFTFSANQRNAIFATARRSSWRCCTTPDLRLGDGARRRHP
jgi:hypothetical protein